MADAELIAPIVNGEVVQTTPYAEKTSKTHSDNNELGKDAFLQLLVCQMQNQDPLNPSTDTEFVSQLATFSQLEQMQNLNSTATNAQAFNLVGKYVEIKTEDSSGKERIVEGTVDFVTKSNGKTYLSVSDQLYPIDQMISVIDDTYIILKGVPSIEKVNHDYDGEKPEDFVFEVSMGTGSTVATDLAIILDGKVLDASYYSVKDGVVTIKKDGLKDLTDGQKKVIVVFNDALQTVITDKVTITVTNSKATGDTTEEDSSGDGEGEKEDTESI